MKHFILFLLALCVHPVLHGQTFSKEVDALYNFSPSRLEDSEMETKSGLLDGFWQKVKADTATYLPRLRTELAATTHSPFFYFDGSSLLLSLSRRPQDKALAADAIAKCDLNDINRRAYVGVLNQLANEGANTTKAALKILQEEDYGFVVEQHALFFNQGYCLAYTLLPLPPGQYVDSLVNTFYRVNENAQKAIITTLWFACSCKGDTWLRAATTDTTLKPAVREYAQKILSYTAVPKEYARLAKSATDREISEVRKKALRRFSDEAIGELDVTTRVLRKGQKCQ
jgi:hypothetical protein